MTMKNIFKPWYAIPRLAFMLTAVLLLSINTAQATGPVSAASLPGGATVVDSDGGSGEQWGRAGGRTINYSDFVLANFTELDWQAISAGMAFDGEITGATLEEMIGPSLIAPNTLQWSGETTITNDITNSVETVYTRFTVIADTIFSGPPPYTIDVFLAGGNFEINILFEASLNPGGPFEPALDFFDAYPTPIAHDGFAITALHDGFFYEQLVGMTLEEHDNNMQGRFDNVDGAIDFLRIESINRLTDIDATVWDNNDKLIWIKSDLEELLNAGAGDWATEEDINFLRDFLSQEHDGLRERMSETDALILCMWLGNELFPLCPPEVPPGLPNLITLTAGQAAIMEKLELAASQEVDVTAVKSPRASSKSEFVFMVLTKVNGVPVDAVITAVTAVTESEEDGIGIQTPPFDTSAVSTGFQSLVLDVSDNLTSTKTVIISVEYVDGDSTLQGTVLVSDW